MLDIDRIYPHPRDHRLDLVLLIQKNPSPLNDLYHGRARLVRDAGA
jgi:hypothetical protein